MDTKQTVKLNYLRMAPRKVRLVADLVRGLSVNEAEAQLAHERRRPAKPILKLLRSAVAAAKAGKRMDAERLYIEIIQVDQGPMMKRSLPRARGMATPLQKKMSHVILTLGESAALKPPRFTIVVPKKIKSPAGEKTGPKRKKSAKEIEKVAAQTKRPGFWRKMFRRKSV